MGIYGAIEVGSEKLQTTQCQPKSMPATRKSIKRGLMALLAIAIIGICWIQFSNVIPHGHPLKLYKSNHVNEEYTAPSLPHKFLIDYVTPRKGQRSRGTCWDFASVGVLEQSYRAQGIAQGWLHLDEYVSFSEQAYGAEMLRVCSGPKDSQQQVNCRVAGDSIWENSTEGGEAPELFYMMHSLRNSIFPHSICPYYFHDGNDTTCPGVDARRSDNPLLFTVKTMDTVYDDVSAKQLLFKKKKAMTFTTAMTYITHYYPCIGKFMDLPQCDEASDTCELCPPDMPMTTCCVPIPFGNNRNIHGEFFAHRGMTIEGGHVMTLVGYNDMYRTKDGFTGGFILKNSWVDGPTQGSHSMAYWMQEISDWEERVICPNSMSAYSWYQCGNAQNSEFAGRRFNRSRAFAEGIGACLSDEAKLYADTNIQPLHLKCADSKHCNVSPEFTYFAKNMTAWGDRMFRVCMFEYNEATKASRDFCMTPLLMVDVSKSYRPIEVKQNDPDRCGFYFFPYEAIRQYITLFEGFFVNNFDIEWHPQSFSANEKHFPHLNYSLIKESTKKQAQYKFKGPFPFARIV